MVNDEMTRLLPKPLLHDTIAVEDEDAVRGQVAEAFKLLREGDLLALGALPLAQTHLVTDCLLPEELPTLDVRGRLIHSLLRWTVEKLRPGGAQIWTQPAWRAYNILDAFYLQGQRAAEVAERLAIAEQTLYQWRAQALATASRIVQAELATHLETATRRRYAIADRCAQQSPNEQQILSIAAIFPRSVPTTLLHQLGTMLALQDITGGIHRLVSASLLLSDEEETNVAVQGEMRSYLVSLLQPALRQQLQATAGGFYAVQGDYLEAARRWRAAGRFEAAANLLITQQRFLVEHSHTAALSEVLDQFRSNEVSPTIWVKLKLAAGDLAEVRQNVDVALAEYQQALHAPDLQTKATAYYRRARVFEHKNIDEALAHYAYGIRLLEEARSQSQMQRAEVDKLLVRMYIQRAWIFIQVRPDPERAGLDLKRAQGLIYPADRRLWCDLYNALGEFAFRQGQAQESVQQYWQAWLAANEVGDSERMCQMAHNLGLIYMDALQQYDQALDYLGRSLALAQQTGNRRMEGLCAMSLGACYFWLGQYATALTHYQTAAYTFRATGNQTLLARTCYGLAEAYAVSGDLPQAQTHYQEGLAIATALNDEAALADLAALAQQFPALVKATALGERQQHALAYLQKHGEITNRAYQDLTGVSQKQTVRDLNELVGQGLLARVGNGRATRYVLRR